MSNIPSSGLNAPPPPPDIMRLIKHHFSYHLDVVHFHLPRFCAVNNERRQKPQSVAPFVISPAFKMSCVQRRHWERLPVIAAGARGHQISPANAHWGRLTAGIRFSV